MKHLPMEWSWTREGDEDVPRDTGIALKSLKESPVPTKAAKIPERREHSCLDTGAQESCLLPSCWTVK